MASDKKFFDAPSPTGDRDTRREAIADYASNVKDEAERLARAVEEDDLTEARKRLVELRAWTDAIDDNICERDPDTGERAS